MIEAFEHRVDPEFVAVLGDHAGHHVDTSEGAAYGIWDDGTLAYFNREWFDFALRNDGDAIFDRWPLGANLWDAVQPPLRTFYSRGLRRCRSSGKPWGHTYECSSPDLLRRHHMLTYPLDGGRGFLIINSLLSEIPHPLDHDHPHDERNYVDSDGFIHQCMHCRRVRRPSDGWDWVPQLVKSRHQNMSGTLCAPCFRHHYPGAKLP